MRLIVLSGTAGAGKMTAFGYFEDIGYYAVDNIPPRLLPALAVECEREKRQNTLVIVDSRCGEQVRELPAVLDSMEAQGKGAELLFLDSNDDVLVQRFKETRRPHPYFQAGQGGILEAIRAERTLLEEVRGRADRVVDTSALTPAELATVLSEVTGERSRPRLMITVQSFGFKHGLPIDADLVFDVRFLANPHYVPELKPLTGMSSEVVSYIHRDPLTEPLLEKMFDFVGFSLPQYQREGKAYLTIAIGCTGGRHRSVALSEELAMYLQREGYRVTVFHRDINRDGLGRVKA
jgi:RNase adapter protein RapZ